MNVAEDKFYRVYSYQDELETGKCIRFRHEISFDESKADLTELVGPIEVGVREPYQREQE